MVYKGTNSLYLFFFAFYYGSLGRTGPLLSFGVMNHGAKEEPLGWGGLPRVIPAQAGEGKPLVKAKACWPHTADLRLLFWCVKVQEGREA